ncbi:MAG: hypothetical protein BGO13_08680 [Burkholderiales bacterium 66-5]|nr:MAG: hypothetical protein BGO13_08680 [Burkholderiales bacterium 66-5]
MTEEVSNPGAAAAPAAQAPAAPVATPAAAQVPATAAPVAAPVTAPVTAPAPRAPEQYEAFTLPEGLTGDAAPDFTAFNTLAKDLDLSQQDAQKLVDFQAKAVSASRAQWAEAAHADKEFGGEKLDENVAVARKAIDTFGTPELKAWLNQTGIGNHPELIRAFYRAGKAMSDDKIVVGKQAPAATRSLADRLYG